MSKRILIIRLDRIGDVVLSTPAIKALRDAYPDGYIAFMVRPYAREVVEGNPYLDEVIIYDKSGKDKGLLRNIKFVQDVRRKKFDIAVVLHPTTRSHLIAALAGIPEIIGYDRKMGFLVTKKVPHTKQFGLRHERDYILGLLELAGIKAEDKKLYMPIKEESEKRVSATFAKNGVAAQDKLVVLNPGASCASKRWDAARFAEVGDALIERRGAKILVVAGHADRVFGDKVASLMKRPCINLSGETSVADLASIFRRSKLLISNDSGPVHIACAAGTPVISIFGRSDRGLSPLRWGPTGERDVVLHKDVGCRMCLAHNCEIGHKCLDAITAAEVIAESEKLI